ncbi:cytoplasmic tRNA 2-thiolation protein 2 isoform X2 [Sphaeramia orbicularis]|uniref:Cytoplasmic tRNA 2-thiolation protein 2 n=1 Tax=Sphaeramia orbicularis TaxID=375764 RepID=A0A673AX93_9TELE|nr:cytoplasmic tRNA 2-thiolation protein 2 isoform X2 [Sphaeramia orbicularis]
MCQVDEDFQGQLEHTEVPSISKKCVKCKEKTAVVVIRAGDTYCRDCFREYFIHKFRAMLGKNRIIFPGEKVLLAVSGGPSSCSMLSQVQEGLSQNAHKKLRFIPGIVYIDEGAAAGRSVDDRKTAMAQMQTLFEATGFPFHLVPLEQVLDLSPSVLVMAPSPSEQPGSAYKAAVDQFIQSKGHWPPRPQDQDQDQDLDQASLPDIQESHTQLLQQLMSSTKTQTAREELLSMLRQHLLVHTARTKGYSKLMLGDCCSRLAVKLLSSIALGRGAQLAQDTGFSDSRYGDIITVRPMRDYSSKEIVFYNHMFKVPSIFIPGLDTMTADKSSIQRLTESFVTKLQADFPSTVSTIYRTSEKLQTAWKGSCAADVCDTCLLCLCALDTTVENASAFQATLISEQLSQTKPPETSSAINPNLNPGSALATTTGQCCSGEGECGKKGGGCCSSPRVPETTDMRSLLCYSCRQTVKDMSSVDHLPAYILLEAQRRNRRSQMREQISEFILDEGV